MEKLIYVDSDLLFLADVRELWEFPLDGYPAAAVMGRQRKAHLQNLDLPEDARYFNSGVMLYNLKQMHAENCTRQFAQVREKYADKLKYPDQDILNIVFRDRCRPLPVAWNFYTSLYRNPPQEGLYSTEDILNALQNPGVAHFSGVHKPWKLLKYHRHPFSFCYYQFARKAGVRKILIWKLFLKNLVLFKLSVPKEKVPWGPAQVKKIRL